MSMIDGKKAAWAALTSSATTAFMLGLTLLGSTPIHAQQAPAGSKGRERHIPGEMALVADGSGGLHPVATWARVAGNHDKIKEVGVTIPLALLDDQPMGGGPGPAGAIASLDFPAPVQQATYFNHFELHSQPDGHTTPLGSANPDRNSVPHYDFHFYAIPEAQVRTIPPGPPRPQVAADRLPEGYLQPGPSLAQMGRHSAPAWSLTDPGFLSTIMIAGFLPDASFMHFIEPMVSRERLLEAEDFELPVPMPWSFGRVMLYPTRFEAEYDRNLDAYHFVFSKFVVVE